MAMIEYIRAGGDFQGRETLDKIRCPDCNRAFMHKSKFNPTIIICDECGLKIPETELQKDTRYLPDVGQYGKPFLNQVAANKIMQDNDSEGRAFVAGISDQDKLNSFSLSGMAKAKTGGLNIDSPKQITDKTIDAIKPIVERLSGTGKEIKKVELK